jgi:hypothetical protein
MYRAKARRYVRVVIAESTVTRAVTSRDVCRALIVTPFSDGPTGVCSDNPAWLKRP